MDNRSCILLSLRDSLLWIILTTLTGLVQILLYLMVSVFVTDKTFDFSVWIKNGAIVAFSLALVASIFFDTHFQKNHKKIVNKKEANILDEYFGGLFYKTLPWLIVLMVTFSTMIDIFVDLSGLNKMELLNTQIAGVVMSYIYAFYYKYCSYYVGVRKDV